MGTSTEDIMFEVSTPASAPHRTPTRELHATYTTFEILVALVAIVGNAMVIYVFRCERRLRRRTNYYIVSLAVADLLVGLLGIPFAILASVGLPKNLYACLFTCSLLVMLCTISIFCLVAVSVDRYWAILHPMCYSRNVRTKTAIGGGHGGHGGGHGGHGGGHGGYGSHGGGHHGGHSSRGYGSYGYHYVTASHTHYTYHPPRSISCHSCSSSTTYPVYRQQPPTYVYVYKDSNSRYNQLLTGLALYNLGRSSGGSHHSDLHYTVYPQEKCSMQIIKGLHFEETEIPCFMISSFTQPRRVNNTLSVDITSSQIDVKSYINSGEPIEVTEGQECILWRNSSLGKEIINDVPCTLLKEYANTVRPSGVPVYIWLPTLLASILTIYLCCWCFYKKKKESVKETAPLNEAPVAGYCANY